MQIFHELCLFKVHPGSPLFCYYDEKRELEGLLGMAIDFYPSKDGSKEMRLKNGFTEFVNIQHQINWINAVILPSEGKNPLRWSIWNSKNAKERNTSSSARRMCISFIMWIHVSIHKFI